MGYKLRGIRNGLTTGDEIEITLLAIAGSRVMPGIHAPDDVRIKRSQIYVPIIYVPIKGHTILSNDIAPGEKHDTPDTRAASALTSRTAHTIPLIESG